VKQLAPLPVSTSLQASAHNAPHDAITLDSSDLAPYPETWKVSPGMPRFLRNKDAGIKYYFPQICDPAPQMTNSN
jgi:hypothetical protein